jgi:hypothetical protein
LHDEIQKLVQKEPHYHAYAAKVRAAASRAGLDPRAGQATAWTTMMAMTALARAGLKNRITPDEIIENLNHEHIKRSSVDFARLIQENKGIRDLYAQLAAPGRGPGGRPVESGLPPGVLGGYGAAATRAAHRAAPRGPSSER